MAGITTFITIAYLLIIVPITVSDSYIIMGKGEYDASIANGIAVGLISFCLIKLFTGQKEEIKLLTAVTAIIFALRYALISLG